jgi:hypothetical protein
MKKILKTLFCYWLIVFVSSLVIFPLVIYFVRKSLFNWDFLISLLPSIVFISILPGVIACLKRNH